MSIARTAIGATILSLCACSTTGTFTGKVTDTGGKPVSGVRVLFWQNKWIPFYLPERVAETKTDVEGRYELVIEEHVSFIVFQDMPISYSREVKPKGANGNYQNDFQVP